MLEKLTNDNHLTLLTMAVEDSINAIGMTDLKGVMIYVNKVALKLWGYSDKQEMIGRFLPEFWKGKRIFKTIEELQTKGYSKGEDTGKRKDNSTFNVEYNASIIRDDFGEPLAMFGSFFDITKRITAQKIAEKQRQILKVQSSELAELNAALKVMIKAIEEEKDALKDNVLSNVNKLISPYLQRLQNGKISDRQKDCLEIIRTNLNQITSPFARNFSSIYYNLTPQQIEIANLIKLGKTNKEIAAIIGLSIKTIESHRTNIRKKLGLKSRKDNLRTHLLSHDKP